MICCICNIKTGCPARNSPKTAFRHFDHVHEILHGIAAEAGAIQPSETSRIIITLNPTAKKIVPMFECFPSDISGISSSTTT